MNDPSAATDLYEIIRDYYDKMRTMTYRENPGRQLEDARAYADELLAAVNACDRDDADGFDESASYLAKVVRPDVQPLWDAWPSGTERYERCGFGRGA